MFIGFRIEYSRSNNAKRGARSARGHTADGIPYDRTVRHCFGAGNVRFSIEQTPVVMFLRGIVRESDLGPFRFIPVFEFLPKEWAITKTTYQQDVL
jgi:hypothetical protein